MDSDPLTSPLITSERPMVACSMEELTVLMEPLEIGLAKFWVFNLSDGCNMVRTSRSWAACAFACRMREPDDVWANARSNYRMRLPSRQVTEVACTLGSRENAGEKRLRAISTGDFNSDGQLQR